MASYRSLSVLLLSLFLVCTLAVPEDEIPSSNVQEIGDMGDLDVFIDDLPLNVDGEDGAVGEEFVGPEQLYDPTEDVDAALLLSARSDDPNGQVDVDITLINNRMDGPEGQDDMDSTFIGGPRGDPNGQQDVDPTFIGDPRGDPDGQQDIDPMLISDPRGDSDGQQDVDPTIVSDPRDDPEGQDDIDVGPIGGLMGEPEGKADNDLESINDSREDPDGQEDINPELLDLNREVQEDEDTLFGLEVDCDDVEPFPDEMFAAQNDDTKVYNDVERITEGAFRNMDFDKYITVFGIRIIGTQNVSEDVMIRAAHVYAGFIDNDEDGVVDRPQSVQSVKDYHVIVSFLANAEESDRMWNELFPKPENEGFRVLFNCRMHLFEQWAADATPESHANLIKRAGMAEGSAESVNCTEKFDWTLWYAPFTVSYYGYLEDFPDDTLEALIKATTKAQTQGKFLGFYGDDRDMSLADFLVWYMLTKMRVLEFHCKIQEVWKFRTPKDMEDFDPEWYDIFNRVEGLPTRIPNPQYNSPALMTVENPTRTSDAQVTSVVVEKDVEKTTPPVVKGEVPTTAKKVVDVVESPTDVVELIS